MSVNPRVLILGAGRGQVGLIRAANEMGLTAVVASMPSNTAPGLTFADVIATADISDPREILEVAQLHEVNAIATSCADTGVPAVGLVSEKLDLIGLSADAAQICDDKLLMKKAFEQHGVRSAKFREVAEVEDLENVLIELSLPLIVKATDLQGSQGIYIARTEDELHRGFEFSMEATRRKSVIVEEFIEGEEFGAQAMIQNGELVFVLPHSDEVLMAKTAVPVGHAVPLVASDDLVESTRREVVAAVTAVGLDNCAVNVDLISRDGEVFIIELTGRAGANGLPEMVSEYFDVNYYEEILKLALGRALDEKLYEQPAGAPAVAVRMIARPNIHGEVASIGFDPETVGDAEVVLFRTQGDQIDGFTSSADCIGQVTVTAQTLEAAFKRLDEVDSAVQIELK